MVVNSGQADCDDAVTNNSSPADTKEETHSAETMTSATSSEEQENDEQASTETTTVTETMDTDTMVTETMSIETVTTETMSTVGTSEGQEASQMEVHVEMRSTESSEDKTETRTTGDCNTEQENVNNDKVTPQDDSIEHMATESTVAPSENSE